MIHLPLAASVPFIMKLVAIIWVLSAFMLIFIILIQKGKGGGLSGAFGGMGAGGLLGTKTGDFLTWVTIGLVAAFLGLGVVMVKYYKPTRPADIEQIDQMTAPAALPDGGDAAPAGENAADR